MNIVVANSNIISFAYVCLWIKELNNELSRKLEAQTQRLELLTARSMVNENISARQPDSREMRDNMPYADEGDEVPSSSSWMQNIVYIPVFIYFFSVNKQQFGDLLKKKPNVLIMGKPKAAFLVLFNYNVCFIFSPIFFY